MVRAANKVATMEEPESILSDWVGWQRVPKKMETKGVGKNLGVGKGIGSETTG